jgi:hypothetical protein
MWSCHQLLKEFAAGKPDAVRGLIPIGEELAGIGADIPFFTDPGGDRLRSQLQVLHDEPLE